MFDMIRYQEYTPLRTTSFIGEAPRASTFKGTSDALWDEISFHLILLSALKRYFFNRDPHVSTLRHVSPVEVFVLWDVHLIEFTVRQISI